MSYRLDKSLKYVRRGVEDALDEAGDAYDDFRDEIGRKASRAWKNREDYLDEAVSAAETVGDVIAGRFKSDPIGTIAIGAIAFWLIGKMIRR